MIEFYFCRTLGILKGQIEDKKLGLEPTKVLYLQGRNRKIFRSVFGSNEKCRICFRDYLTFSPSYAAEEQLGRMNQLHG